MHKFIFTIALTFPLLFSQAQERYERKIAAHEQITGLKSGALIVRLSKRQTSVDALRNAGYAEAAEKITKEQYEANLALLQAFRSDFNFCKVYFIYPDQSPKILNNQLGEVVFLNDQLKEDSTIKMSESYFLTAEYGIIAQDTTGTSLGYSYQTSWDKHGTKTEYYRNGGANLRVPAFIMKDQSFVQLRDPFPFFVKRNVVFIKRDDYTVVTMLNEQLSNFLN